MAAIGVRIQTRHISNVSWANKLTYIGPINKAEEI